VRHRADNGDRLSQPEPEIVIEVAWVRPERMGPATRIADASRADVESAMVGMPAPFGVSAETAAVMALDSYPFSNGPVGSVDKVRLQRVVDVMEQFLGFPKFDISSMLMGSG
jgi:hypothetical protein